MTSQLPPREIQARIRAGETPEDVATAAQTTVEKVMLYARPVLAERAHIAGLALAGSVRTADGGAGVLEELVARRLTGTEVAPDDVEWDAWKQAERRWTVVAQLPLDGVVQQATFTFDLAGRYAVAEDALGRWLTGEDDHRRHDEGSRAAALDVAEDAAADALVADAEIPLPPAPAEQTLRAVHEGALDHPERETETESLSGVDAPASLPQAEPGQLSLGDDAIALVTGSAPTQPARTQPAQGSAAGWDDVPDAPSWLDPPSEGGASPSSAPSAQSTPDPAPAQDVLFGAPPDEHGDAERSRPSRKRGRTAIPSWDEIMFGGPADGTPASESSEDQTPPEDSESSQA